MKCRRAWARGLLLLVIVGIIVGAAAAQPLRQTAYRRALAGFSSTSILSAAFPGTVVRAVSPVTIRVLVADLAKQVVFGANASIVVTDQFTSAVIAQIPAGHRVSIVPVPGGGLGYDITDLDTSTPQVYYSPDAVVVSAASTLRMLNPALTPSGLAFHGSLLIHEGTGGYVGTLSVINMVGIEDYVAGVLGGQIPTNWGPRARQAVIASAIALRSQAYVHRVVNPPWGFDVTADTPIYLGIDGERPATRAAVTASRGRVVERHGRVVAVGFVGIAPVIFAPSPGHPDVVTNGPTRPISGLKLNQASIATGDALSMLHHPYVYGGRTPGGFDCSGLMYWVWNHAGFWRTTPHAAFPRDAASQSRVGYPVQRNDLQPGDEVFFADRSGYVFHVGMYIGNGLFVHAANPAQGVRVDSLIVGYYARSYAGARRYSLPSSPR